MKHGNGGAHAVMVVADSFSESEKLVIEAFEIVATSLFANRNYKIYESK